MTTLIREAKDKHERKLLKNGWEFSGFSLFKHPTIRHRHFTKADAIKENARMGNYMTTEKKLVHSFYYGFCGGIFVGAIAFRVLYEWLILT